MPPKKKAAKAATGTKKPVGRPRKVKKTEETPVVTEEPTEVADDDQKADEAVKVESGDAPADDAAAKAAAAKAHWDTFAEPLNAEFKKATGIDPDKESNLTPEETEALTREVLGMPPKIETVRSCLRIVVPSVRAGYVIGPRGMLVKHMRKESGCGFHLQEVSKKVDPKANRVAVVTCADPVVKDEASIDPGSFKGIRGVGVVYQRSTEVMIPKDADLANPPMGERPAEGEHQVARMLVAASQVDKLDVSDLATDAGADCEAVTLLDEDSDDYKTIKESLTVIMFPTDRVLQITGKDAAVQAVLHVAAMRLDYRVNPPVKEEDPLLLIDAPDVKEGYFKEKKERERKERGAAGRDGAGRDGKGRHHPYGGGGRGGGGYGNKGPQQGPDRGGGGGSGGGGGEIRMTFEVDAQWAGGVIGKAGSNVAAIRRESGARITVRESNTAGGKVRAVQIDGTERQCHDARHLVQSAVTKQGGGPVGRFRIDRDSNGRGGRDGRGRDSYDRGRVHALPPGGSYYDQYDRGGGYDQRDGGYGADRGGYHAQPRDRGGYGNYNNADDRAYDRGGYGRDPYYDRGGHSRGDWIGGDRGGGYNNYQDVQQSHQQQQGWAGQNQQWGGSAQTQSYQQQSHQGQQSYQGQQQSYDQSAGYHNNQQGAGGDYYNRGQQSGYGNQGAAQYDQQGDYRQQYGSQRY